MSKKSQKNHFAAKFTPENEVPGSAREYVSPSGRYKLVVTHFNSKPGYSGYTQGKLFRQDSDKPFTVVNRNFYSFQFNWIEGHPNGHDYLVCGEDYQGSTVVELDTGNRRSYVPEEAKQGFGFCWVGSKLDVASKILIVEGCIWACPYEYRFYDFADPMNGWPEIVNDVGIEDDHREPEISGDVIKVFQTKRADGADENDENPEMELQAFSSFRREGNKLIFLEEWVSEKEQKTRADRERSRKEYEDWYANWKLTDPLYLAHKEMVLEPLWKPDDHAGVGITYKGWCPDFLVEERRFCRRILSKGKVDTGPTVDLEWGMLTGPIKVVLFRDGKHIEDVFFEHSVEGMQKAFERARESATV